MISIIGSALSPNENGLSAPSDHIQLTIQLNSLNPNNINEPA